MNTTVYSIHYVQSFRSDVIQHNIGCEDAVAYGVYVYPNGAIDAMHMLLNGNVYGFSQMCRKKDTYYKLFGTQQDYDELFRKSATIVKEHLIGAINRGGAQALIIDWKAEPNKISK